jgi:hypothetical protein
MSYKSYKAQVTPLCPVAVKLGQFEVHAPDHDHWGIVTCDSCEEKFFIGPNRIHGSRATDVNSAKALEVLLADDHNRKRPHENSYELQD